MIDIQDSVAYWRKKLDGIQAVTIATPCYGNSLTSQFYHSAMLSMEALSRIGIQVNLVTIDNDSLIERARNTCVLEYLSDPRKGDFLIFIDADIGWQPKDLLILLDARKECCGMAYPAKIDKRQFVCNIVDQNPFKICPDTGFIKASHIGTGMMVLSRDMLVRMWSWHLLENKYYKDWNSGRDVAKLFETAISEDKHYWSEDYVFCQKWVNMGGSIWLYPYGWMKHHGGKVWMDCLGKDWEVRPIT